MNGSTTAERELMDLANGLHSDLVHSVGVGRTMMSSERENLRVFPTGGRTTTITLPQRDKP